MRVAKLLMLICMLFISNTLVVQAAEVDKANAVASVILEDETQVFYYDSIADAVNKAADNEGSTVQLLSSILLEHTILITTGNFTFDLHGERVECFEPGDIGMRISGGTICLKDSSSEQTGTIEGTATGVEVQGSANVSIESGNYQANAWGLMTSLDNLSSSEPTVELKGGNFHGSVAVSHGCGELTISGGEYRSNGQSALNVSDKADVRGGTFYGQIEVFFTGTLDFRDGRLFVHDYTETSSTPTVYGINNTGTLNLSGGTIMVDDDEDNPVCGIKNQTLDETGETPAVLHLLGDITFDEKLCADFYLRGAMTIDYALKNCYRILWMKAYEDETTIFATAGEGITLSRDNFVLDKKGYLVVLSENQSSLAVSKCDHPEVDSQSACKICGTVMQARIENQYYESMEDVLNAVTDKQTVVLLSDLEGLSIGSGTFSLDLNGYAIKNALSIADGSVTLKGKGSASGEEYIERLSISPGAHVEIQGVTVKGTDRAITNLGGELVLKSGEINAEKIAIINIGGSVTIGEEGAGPVIKAPIGIINSNLVMEEMHLDAVLRINGGSITAETDIYNQTGEYPHEEELLSEISLTAGTVNLKGGTFVDGLHVMLDEGLNLKNILDESCSYYGMDGQAIPVGSDTVQLNQTVMVESSTKLSVISTSGNCKTTYGQSCTIGVSIEKDTTVYDYTYQWYDASGKIKGATSEKYTVPADQSAGDYSYFCRVTATRKDNGLSATKDSEAIRVTVGKAKQPQLKITGVPEKIIQGDTFTLKTSGGASGCDLSWSITSGKEIASIDQKTGKVTISGAGTFTVKVISKSNENYIETTQSVTLTAQQAEKQKNKVNQSNSPDTSDEGPDKWISAMTVVLFALCVLLHSKKSNVR